MRIYHIVLPGVWAEYADRDRYEAESLETEGFIHCSYAEQLEGVLERYYRDAAEVLILEIETDRLTAKLIAEPSTNEEVYPHVYGPIDRAAIVGVARRRPATGAPSAAGSE